MQQIRLNGTDCKSAPAYDRYQIKPAEGFLTIEHGKRYEFTEEYINLTKDFYLKF